ncbi:1-deoxy-D-xylulose-5-phosphate reductoisomerase [Candidatus Pelagibacter sp. HIMB1493]|uniref:1-deoxy-D-xylulose-5-phosphate reductoisomerase n=1 Tax=Candidatus Pelagibacter sp. HIMB1493 TaxID=3413334 RepID=UPI003F82C91E
MIKKIAILGSTGSIGSSLIDIISKDKKKFKIILLTANQNDKKLINQAKLLNVKNLIITDKKKFNKLKKNKNNFNLFNDFKSLNKILKNKVDYVMCAITGIEGLLPTYNCIKHTKNIAIANKESLICAWDILEKEMKKHNTQFIPIDSEHFSLWSAIKLKYKKNIEKLYITASGGPFYKLPINKFINIKIKDAINHPNWRMGKKISIDSATMMNKVFEVIEARNIFEVHINKINILIHTNSYIHAMVKFNNAVSKIILHDTDMKIPIFNSIYQNKKYFKRTSDIDLKILNNLNLKEPDLKKFPLIKILKKIPPFNSLFETVIITINDFLVDLFLKKKISFVSISKIFFLEISNKEFQKYRNIRPKNLDEILELKNFVQKRLTSRYI